MTRHSDFHSSRGGFFCAMIFLSCEAYREQPYRNTMRSKSNRTEFVKSPSNKVTDKMTDKEETNDMQTEIATPTPPNDAPPSLAVAVTGEVKWFDPVKGFGFIIVDDEGGDILIHHEVLRLSGYDMIYTGASVKCLVIDAERGRQAEKIISIDNSKAALPERQPRPTSIMQDIKEISDFVRVTVKWFNRTKGYGFVSMGEGQSDIFIHMEILRLNEIEDVQPGQPMEVAYGEGPKGLMATRIRLVEPESPA